MEPGGLLLVVGTLLAVSVVVALGSQRTGLPLLVGFLGLGMVLGSDGPVGIDFDNAELARTVGVIGLAAILFEGGLSTSWRRLREVAVAAGALATVGVVVTAVIVGLAGTVLFELSLLEGVLLGAVVASTDAAAVFATLRFTRLRRRLARLLEAESGTNDPMAVALVVGLIAWLDSPGSGLADLVGLVVRQLGLGLLVGVLLGALATRVFDRFPPSIGAFAPVASIAAAALSFGAADVVGGSGFLAVYVVGLAVGSTPSRYRSQLVAFHEGIAFLAQVVLFVVLGLLVFPHELPAVALPSLALSAILIFVARPVSVLVSLSGRGFSRRERAFIGWAGLRGAVPIVLATFVLSADLPQSNTLFNAVFFVVIVSALLQGTTLESVARRLGLVEPLPPGARRHEDGEPELEVLEFPVEADDAIADAAIRELGLLRAAHVTGIRRGGTIVEPQDDTVVRPGDVLLVIAPRRRRPDVEDVFARWRRRI